MYSAEPHLLLFRRQHPPHTHIWGTRGRGVDVDGETGPGVLSGTGRQLATESGREAERPRGRDLQVIRNGGCTDIRVTDTALLSELSAG